MSKYDTTSTFPHQIDPPVFFSDIRLEHEVALSAYKELIAEKKYDEAIAYLEAHTEVDAYCSDLFNMLINRTKAVQKYASGDYTPPAASNPVTMLGSLPSDASGVSGNTVCMSGDSISNLKIVSWADGTWEEISAMLDAHYDYNNDFSLYDHWNIGDKKIVSIGAMAGLGNSNTDNQPAQNIEIVLTGKDVYYLSDSGKCAFTWDTVDCLSNYGTMSNTSVTNRGGWDESLRRQWCNNIFYNNLPSGFKSLLKQVAVKAGLGGGSSSGVKESLDYCFLRSAYEVMGIVGSSAVSGESSIQLDYYKTSSNRIKKRNGSDSWWWLRSPCSGDTKRFCQISTNGGLSYGSSNELQGLVICGCI